jgi:hypothetical protein
MHFNCRYVSRGDPPVSALPVTGLSRAALTFFYQRINHGTLASCSTVLIPAKVQRGDRDPRQRALVCFQTVMDTFPDNTGSGTDIVCLKHL